MQKKRGMILSSLLLSLSMISLASASVITDIIYTIGEDNITFAIIFIVCFAAIGMPLKKVFKENKMEANVIAGALSVGISIFLLQYGYIGDISNIIFDLFSGIGISGDSFYTIMIIAILVGLVLFSIFISLGWAFAIVGIIILILSNYAYEEGFVIFVGIGFILLGALIGYIKYRTSHMIGIHRGFFGLLGGGRRPF